MIVSRLCRDSFVNFSYIKLLIIIKLFLQSVLISALSMQSCLFEPFAREEFTNYSGIVFSGGSWISPRWGANPREGGANVQFCQIFPKLYEIERIWTLGCASLAPPSLDLPMVLTIFQHQLNQCNLMNLTRFSTKIGGKRCTAIKSIFAHKN